MAGNGWLNLLKLTVVFWSLAQVEIEARFMEVQDGALEELGVNWSVATSPTQNNARAQALYQTTNRSLANAFTNQGNNRQGRIVGGETGLDQVVFVKFRTFDLGWSERRKVWR